MARLDRLTVRGFKSIHVLQDFELGALNVLIGANGAGKSNFISLLRMAAELVALRLQHYVSAQDSADALLFGGRKQTSQIDAEFYFGPHGYRISLTPAGDRLVFAREETWVDGNSGVHIHPLGSGHDEARLLPANDEAFGRYVGPTIAEWRVYHFDDTSATAAVRNTQAVRDNLRLKPDGGNLAPVLRHLREQHPDACTRIVESIRLVAPFFGDFVYRKTPGERVGLEWFEARDPDTVRGPRQLSDGTLRFICLATLLLQPAHLQPDTILIDEPELGLHPYAIAVLGALIRQASTQRQLIISTQSAELLNEVRPEDIIVVNRKDDESSFERLEPERLAEWLEEYTLGELWRTNVLGGRPSR